jgi:hypothetical protein
MNLFLRRRFFQLMGSLTAKIATRRVLRKRSELRCDVHEEHREIYPDAGWSRYLFRRKSCKMYNIHTMIDNGSRLFPDLC